MRKTVLDKYNIQINESEKYIQINDVIQIDKIWPFISQEYIGYQIDFCYHDIIPPYDILKSIGAFICDDAIRMVIEKKVNFEDICCKIVRINKENYDCFARYHDRMNPNVYWNSQRLLSCLDEWSIFAIIDDNNIYGYIMTAQWNNDIAEIFVLEANSSKLGKLLLQKAVDDALITNHKKIIFMTDKSSSEYLWAHQIGFEEHGYYKAFRIQI